MIKMELMSAEQKLAKSMLKLRNLRRYYSALYEALEKVPFGIETIGVDTHKLYYSPKFIEDTPFEELMFINLHEIAHIALMHVARRGGRDKNLWNIACDLYVNQALIVEFNLQRGSINHLNGGVEIKIPSDGCFCSSIDVNSDYVEKIYADLYKQAEKNGYTKAKPGETTKFSFTYTGSLVHDRFSYCDREWTFNINLSASQTFDLCDTGSDEASKIQESRRIVSDARVRSELEERGCGNNTGIIERESNKLFNTHIDWKRLLNRYLVATFSKDSSFARPDKRLSYQNAIYPGLCTDELGELSGVEICIDTSGSISDIDLGTFFKQVESLTKNFKLSAEVVYWDSEVKSTGSFKSYHELERIDCFGGGGTNPKCVFDYFEKNKINPVVTLVLTDGIWGRQWVNSKLVKKYKNTIWILTRDRIDKFEPPFGKKAQIKWEG